MVVEFERVYDSLLALEGLLPNLKLEIRPDGINRLYDRAFVCGYQIQIRNMKDVECFSLKPQYIAECYNKCATSDG